MLASRRWRCWTLQVGKVVNKTVRHEGNQVREFYSGLPWLVRVGIEATGSMQTRST